MLPELLQSTKLFHFLYLIDIDRLISNKKPDVHIAVKHYIIPIISESHGAALIFPILLY